MNTAPLAPSIAISRLLVLLSKKSAVIITGHLDLASEGLRGRFALASFELIAGCLEDHFTLHVR